MLNILNTTDPQVLLVPTSEAIIPEEPLVLVLNGTVSHKMYEFEVTDLQTSRLYYNIALELPQGLEPGEYNYRLASGCAVLSCGLAIVGEYKREITEYEKPIQYEQYED